MQKSRREFLKGAAKTSVAVAGVGVVLAGCDKKIESKNIIRGKSKKEEILYQKSKQWDLYYSVAK
ncbi:twin-arginine translocation signal domain-containing protein [Helicobacter mesocricetorum]|uniref:twin-arginine translocation signal domain-containing protein n=1 Tax=Helicobacter mesocricetorum TaxID=87012 RepID=UPI000CF095EA|nr:twin-arginine translocation signal domain-containing protein [Helicobacter mesocricetorum]